MAAHHFPMMSSRNLKICWIVAMTKWVANLNDSSEQLAFIVSGDKLWAMHNNQVSKVKTIVI